MKQIWDGHDLPEIGTEVLIHLSSSNDWVRHKVGGYHVEPFGDTSLCRVQVILDASDDPRSGTNNRLFADVRPLDWPTRQAKGVASNRNASSE